MDDLYDSTEHSHAPSSSSATATLQDRLTADVQTENIARSQHFQGFPGPFSPAYIHPSHAPAVAPSLVHRPFYPGQPYFAPGTYTPPYMPPSTSVAGSQDIWYHSAFHGQTNTAPQAAPPVPSLLGAGNTSTTIDESLVHVDVPQGTVNDPPAAAGPRRKRRRVNKENDLAQGERMALSGIGPPTAPIPGMAAAIHPALAPPSAGQSSATAIPKTFGSLVRRAMNDRDPSRSASTDVWASVYPVASREKPDIVDPYPLNGKTWARQPKLEEGAFLACKFCTRTLPPGWHAWENTKGMTVTLRNHLRHAHEDDFRRFVVDNNLKGSDEIAHPRAARVYPEFTKEGFEDRLVKYIVASDAPLDEVDDKFFRDLLGYSVAPKLREDEIVHRTKFTELVVTRFSERHNRLLEFVKLAVGRISFTSDLWSSGMLRGFMAVTLHFITRHPKTKRLIYHAELGAFRYVRGSHTGEALAKVFLQILSELGAVGKIGYITLDNASNCDSMVGDLEALLRGAGVTFSASENRLRCFPHVINIAVTDLLKKLTDVDGLVTNLEEAGPLSEHDRAYIEALRKDVIARCRTMVATVRASGQRREWFEDCIDAANREHAFGITDNGRYKEVDVKSPLLRDMDIRWSSKYLMIDRALELHPAIIIFFTQHLPSRADTDMMTPMELEVLADIREVLQAPHAVQEVLSAEYTPTVCHAIPAYERLVDILRTYMIIYNLLAHAIAEAVEALEAYMRAARRNPIYALAMILNPTMKLQWIRDRWSAEEYSAAKDHLRTAMLRHKKSAREARPSAADAPATTSSGSRGTTAGPAPMVAGVGSHTVRAARSQAAGLSRLAELAQRAAAKLQSASGAAADESGTPTPPEPDAAEQSRRAEEKDRLAIEREIAEYDAVGLVEQTDNFNCLQYWESENRFPAILSVAMDVLPVQASSVPCERVFSSAKETDTPHRRGKTSPLMMEVEQFLKHSFNRELLNFSQDEDRLACEQECIPDDGAPLQPPPPPSDMHDVLTASLSGGDLASRLASALAAEQEAPDSDSESIFDY